jgi:hypothetical protein
MKFNLKTAVILSLVLTILFLIFSKRTSGMVSLGMECLDKPIDSKIACVTYDPDYPLAGDMTEDGLKKFCCKTKS